ncbi:MAG TPA: putative DNA modification/repair radical SAM protein [Rectinemataceae bacterium]|nr:putative DNA modification/repair radical SAM protein [Rectinemataceae bacterium]
MTVHDKIGVLADAAKYDASCSTSGSGRKNTPGGLGNGVACGICHSWASDGRCVSLLKVLLSNVCAYDCAYCVNRRSNDVRRAAFEPEELVRLITDFYRRNYIEGAFLSSGVIGCPDATMERLIWVASTLRTRERFNGYIHLKVIPGASEPLVLEAAKWADRVSVNIELPSAASLSRIAPDKTPKGIFGPMRALAKAGGFEPLGLEPPSSSAGAGTRAAVDAPAGAPGGETALAPFAPPPHAPSLPDNPPARETSVFDARKTRARNPEAPLMPAGQTTQLVIGASPESDATILTLAENLYLAYDVRRVYYSAFIPTSADPRLPAVGKPPLAREHRLYQADWLFRFYGFAASEILDSTHPFLDQRMDPKSSWALRNLQFFPVEISTADYKELLRVPGIGPKSAMRITKARRQSSIRTSSLSRLGVVMRRAKWFITVGGRLPDNDGFSQGLGMLGNPAILRRALLDPEFRTDPSLQLDLPWEGGSEGAAETEAAAAAMAKLPSSGTPT